MILKTLLLLLLLPPFQAAPPASPAKMISTFADRDVPLDTDPASGFWRDAKPVFAERDKHGAPLPSSRTEVRSRWTRDSIYFLFICPYQNLYLKPKPNPRRETFELWNWNVAEVFIGSDFDNIKRYKEFEISPHGEWIDLDIDLNKPHHEEGWVWNSGFQHAARVDSTRRIWYAALRIPFSALLNKSPAPGATFRVNLFRTDGPPKATKEIVWQPTMSETFHVPERFGILELEGK